MNRTAGLSLFAGLSFCDSENSRTSGRKTRSFSGKFHRIEVTRSGRHLGPGSDLAAGRLTTIRAAEAMKKKSRKRHTSAMASEQRLCLHALLTSAGNDRVHPAKRATRVATGDALQKSDQKRQASVMKPGFRKILVAHHIRGDEKTGCEPDEKQHQYPQRSTEIMGGFLASTTEVMHRGEAVATDKSLDPGM